MSLIQKKNLYGNFINIFFNDNSDYIINELNNTTYSIEIYASDILETGNTDKVKRQYIIVDNNKINIQDYITSNDINKKSVSNNVIFNIKDVTYYYDYAQYKVYITNSENKVLNIKDIYLQLPKTKINGQVQNEDLQIKPYESKILNIKFDINYKQINTIKNMTIETQDSKIEIEL